MPSYRFCRPDDIPYLVRAVNECFDVHFPDDPPMAVAAFRDEMRTLDVWPSNSMVASSDAGPVAVMIGTKREREVLIRRLGVRPDHRRQGHGRHLVTSLGQKLAVLGPERLVAEVPCDLPGVAELFAAAGYRREASLVDWCRAPAPAAPVPDGWVLPITVDELADQGLLTPNDTVAWERRVETVRNRRDELRGTAVASAERVEAFVLAADGPACVDVVACGGPADLPERSAVFFGVLLRDLASRMPQPIRLPKLADDELPATLLVELGFAAGRRYERWAAVARPA